MRRTQQAGFTLVEIMIVTGIITLMTIVAFPNFIKARKASARNTCISNLKQMEGAKHQWGLEHKKASDDSPSDEDLFGENLYMRIKPVCPTQGDYTLGTLSETATCSNAAEGHALEE